MLKQISVDDLVPGMFVQRIDAPWSSHPFWRRSFPLRTLTQVVELQTSEVSEVWIDTARGIDVPAAPRPAPALPAAVLEPLEAAAAEPPARAPESPPSPAHDGLALCGQARSAVQALFAQARMGRTVDSRGCIDVVAGITELISRERGTFLTLVRVKHRDEYTYMHSVAVAALMVALARTLGFNDEQTQAAGLAGMLHDIGKVSVPLDILAKPARLTELEFGLMREHAQAGHDLLLRSGAQHPMALDVALHHHEKVDGSGYPHGLRGDRISLVAKMAAVCDVYDAVTSDRPYKRAWDPADAVRRMAQWPGHFDPMVFQAFVKTVGIYPVGALVRLASGRLAIVVRQHDDALLTPVVQPFHAIDSGQTLAVPPLDLRQGGDRVASAERPVDWEGRGVVMPAVPGMSVRPVTR